MKSNRITLRAILLGMLASGLFAWHTVVLSNVMGRPAQILSATQIPVLPFLLVMACAVLVNPLLRRIRIIRMLSRAELMLIFMMTMVSSGLSTFGLAAQLVPAIVGLFNPSWNTAQARWDRHIEPFVNESWFLAEPGIQAAAAATREAEDRWREAETALRAARAVAGARETIADLEAERGNAGDDDGLVAARRTRQLDIERIRLEDAERHWRERRPADTGLDAVLAEWPERVAQRRAAYEETRAVLAALETQAFEKVELFRRGLPEPLRAVPGMLPLGDEAFSVYTARLRRLRAGLQVAGDIAAARGALEQGRAEDGLAAVRRAAGRLDAAAATADLMARRDDLTARRDAIDPRLNALRREIEELRSARRLADADAFDALDRAIRERRSEADNLAGELQSITTELAEVIAPRVALAEETAALRDALLETEARWENEAAPEVLQDALAGAEGMIESLNISWRALVAGDVPWGDWARPLARWSVLVLAVYIMLMSFNVLIFRQWAHHEKLSYPLAELPLLLSGSIVDSEGSETPEGHVPALYRTGVFWAGCAISAFTMGWNILATRQIIPGINPIPIRFLWDAYIEDSPLAGLMPSAQHQIFFTMIGLAFLVPARISKSLWSFHLIYMGLLLVLVWMGLGADERAFPANMTMVMNFRSGVGGGALIAFSSLTLWTCRKYLLCAAFPGTLAGLNDAERRELRISSFMFLGSSALVIGIVSVGMGVNLAFAIFCYVVIMMVTIGMVRGVAEGGLLVFQCHFGPFHIIRSTVGMHRTWTSVSLFAPLVAFYYVLFWDLKTFIAPAMANALKIRDSLGLQRLRFHVSLWLGIILAAAVAVATHIILGYQRGANTMNRWFYTGGPQQLFGSITEMAVTSPFDTAGNGYWMLAGIVIMTALLLLRRRKFGLLHPIGLVMWVDPRMWVLWFPIFLGWVFKTLVGRYGDRATYFKFRVFFIGLIAGELLMCLFGVDLNRH